MEKSRRIDIESIRKMGEKEEKRQQPAPAATPPQVSFPSISEELGKGMKDVNQGLQGLPRVQLPTPGDRKGSNIFNPEEERKINNFKKWGLLISIALVVTYASYRIIISIIN